MRCSYVQDILYLQTYLKVEFYLLYSAFQIDELHRHNQNLVWRLHKEVPTVVYRHKNCRILEALNKNKTRLLTIGIRLLDILERLALIAI